MSAFDCRRDFDEQRCGHTPRFQKALLFACLIVASTVFCSSAHATEGGGGVYPNGAENYLAGAMPPPGVYANIFAEDYQASQLIDNNGNNIAGRIGGFSIHADALVPRFIWVLDHQILGGQVAVYTLIPLVDVRVGVGGKSQQADGLGQIVVGAGLGYHLSENLHYAFGLDINTRTGSYEKTDLANLSRNYYNVEPVFVVTYATPAGLNADVKMMYDFNDRNEATEYLSGQEFHADYSIGWGTGNGWVFGAGGYFYQQTTNDNINGVTVPNNKGRAFAIGPDLKFEHGKDWFFTLKYQKELEVRNRPDGSALWVKVGFKFDAF